MLCDRPHGQQRAPHFWKFAEGKNRTVKKERGIEQVAVWKLEPSPRPQGRPLVAPVQQTKPTEPVESVLDGADAAAGCSSQLTVGRAEVLPAAQQTGDPEVQAGRPLAVRQRPVGVPDAVAELVRRHSSPFAEGRRPDAEPRRPRGLAFRLGLSDAHDCRDRVEHPWGGPCGCPSCFMSLRYSNWHSATHRRV